MACKSNQRKKLERLCRYITRPEIAEQRGPPSDCHWPAMAM
ncbi:MAG: hypothetical protein ACFHX7_18875 [Pseudomonadota bacterium]